MKYSVVISDSVLAAVDAQLAFLLEQGASRARVERWLERLLDRVDSLARRPRRYPLAEAVSLAAGYELRRINHGEYALYYLVDDENARVEIRAFRHGRRRPWEDVDL